MEAIGKGIVIFMLVLKSLSPSVGNRVPATGSYVPDPARPPAIRIAVIPFENVSTDANANDRMMDTIITYLLHTQIVDVVEPVLVEQQLLTLKVRKPSEITLKTAAELREALGVDAILMGKITAFQVDNSGGDSIPVIALSARMLDINTLGIMWSTSIVRKGNDKSILFDVGRIDTLSDLSQLAANDLASGLGKELKPVLKGFAERAALVRPAMPVAAGHTDSGHPAPAQENTPPAQVKVLPPKKFSELFPDITDFTKGTLIERQQPVPEAEMTYYKSGIPVFIKLIDCEAPDKCSALRDAKGEQQPGPSVNGDESTQRKSPMGLLILSVVRGRYLMEVSGGDASLEDMRSAGKAILNTMDR